MEMSDDSKDGHADFECIEVAKTLKLAAKRALQLFCLQE